MLRSVLGDIDRSRTVTSVLVAPFGIPIIKRFPVAFDMAIVDADDTKYLNHCSFICLCRIVHFSELVT